VSGTGEALDGGDWRDPDLDTLSRMFSLQHGQEMASQQPKIAWGRPIFPYPAECGDHLVDGDGAQS
jgi:hypothetical protein